MEFTLEDVRIDPEKYCKQIPKYDSLLFDRLGRFDLDIWSPEDYPIVNVDLGDNPIHFLSLLHPHSKMFRFSKQVYSTGNWVEISRIALLLEKIIVDSDTFFKVGDQLMVCYSGMCGKVEDLCSWPKEYDERLKPAIGTRRKCMRFLAMLFFEEIGVSPEFIAAEF